MNYNIYMISITGHPVSEMYKRITMDSWTGSGFKVIHFEAITPKDLYKKHKLDFGKKTTGTKREFTATEKAVWYSHFELWCKCLKLNKPIIVLEHDSKLLKPLPNLDKEGYKFLSFINRDYGKGGIYMAPGSGYYITPVVAQRLVAHAVCGQINQNSDGHLGVNMNYKRQIKMNDFHYIEQINIDGLNTIDHKNPNRNYVGPDYEKIDIPSLHGQEI